MKKYWGKLRKYMTAKPDVAKHDDVNIDMSQALVASAGTSSEPVDIGFGDGTGVFCSNCKSPLSGGFCGTCGQKNTSLTRPIWYLLSDLTEDIISKDSKLFRTLWKIILYPGSLTRDFMDGKRARFIPPVRFYLLCTLTFFITLAVADVAILKIEFTKKEFIESPTEAASGTEGELEIEFEAVAKNETGANREEVLNELIAVRSRILKRLEADDNGMNSSFLNKWALEKQAIVLSDNVEENNLITTDSGSFNFSSSMFQPAEPSADAYALPDNAFDDEKEGIEKQLAKSENKNGVANFFLNRTLLAIDGVIHVSQDPRRLNNTLNDWLSKVMVVLLPFFAILLRLFYWKRENCLMKQLVFSLHFHSAIFLMMTFLIISQAVWGAKVSSSIFYAIVPLYLFIAMKVASRQGIFRTFFKFFTVSFFYLITLVMALLIALMLSFSEI
jgi:hypothetical protein